MNTVLKFILMFIFGIGIGVTFVFVMNYFNEDYKPVYVKSITTNKGTDILQLNNGIIVDKESLQTHVIDMMKSRTGTGHLGNLTIWINFPNILTPPNDTIYVTLLDATNQVLVDDSYPQFGKKSAEITVPDYLKQTVNETREYLKNEFKSHPFITSFTMKNISKITNTTLATITGNVVLDDAQNKVIVLGDGSVIKTDDLWKLGESVTLKKVAHDMVCQITQITLSNQTAPITTNAQQIHDNPEQFGLLTLTEAFEKWKDWSNERWYDGDCDKKEFITWELVQ